MLLDPSDESPADLRVANCQLHGVLVQVSGVGVLLLGDAGSGKTECALELARRGHSFISDDAVRIFEKQGRLFGKPPAAIDSLVHVRGVGVRRFEELFDPAVMLRQCRIDISIEIGATEGSHPMHDMKIPCFNIRPGSSSKVADDVENIVRNYLAAALSN